MSKSVKSAVTMSRREQIWGFAYLLLELLALPLALEALNSLLPVPLPDAWLNFLYFALNFIFTCFLFRSFLKRCLTQAGANAGGFLLVTIVGFCIYYACNLALGVLIQLLAPDFANLNDGNIAQQAEGNYIILVIGTAILVPVAEELLHRGLVFGSLYDRNPYIAYIFSAVLFSSIHILGYVMVYPPHHLLLAFLQYLPAGLVLSWAYRKSGSIFSPILIHAAVNTLALLSLR
jgi:membrane protease YdiL (CAAX protease family)